MVALKYVAESVACPGAYLAEIGPDGYWFTRNPENAKGFSPGWVLPRGFRLVQVEYPIG